jgi:hypothetical protein
MTIAKLMIGSALALVLASGCLASESVPDDWPCKSDADCLASEKCFDAGFAAFPGGGDEQGKRCKRADFCSLDSDCAEDEYCSNTTCTHAGCTSNQQCNPYACNTPLHTCYTACNGSYQCASGWVCAGGACIVQQCIDGNPDPCLGYTCSGGVCGTNCASNTDCAPGYSCVATSCVNTGENLPCSYSYQCTTAPYTYCQSGRCSLVCDQRPCSVEGEECDNCDGDPYVCGADGKCRVACIGVVCGYDGDVYCDNCPPGNTCVNNVCTF